MHQCACVSGLLPEQVWDTTAIPEKQLFPGRPSGSAMPLLWSHAEFLKLLIASADRRPLELLQTVEQHFADQERRRPVLRHWRTDVPFHTLETGMSILVEDTRCFTLHWGTEDWQQIQTLDSSLGPFDLWSVKIPASVLRGKTRLDFTRRYSEGWEGIDHSVTIAGPSSTGD
jgi:glucoamylase